MDIIVFSKNVLVFLRQGTSLNALLKDEISKLRSDIAKDQKKEALRSINFGDESDDHYKDAGLLLRQASNNFKSATKPNWIKKYFDSETTNILSQLGIKTPFDHPTFEAYRQSMSCLLLAALCYQQVGNQDIANDLIKETKEILKEYKEKVNSFIDIVTVGVKVPRTGEKLKFQGQLKNQEKKILEVCDEI